MTISLLTAKALLAPVAGVVAVGAGVGGTYYVYTNRSTSNSSNTNSSAQTKTPIKTNTFLGRVETAGTAPSTITSPLKCEISDTNKPNCKVFKFNTPQTNNTITKFDKLATTTEITAATDLKAKNYVLVELEGEAVTFETLKNKSISLKSGDTEITKLNFDQLLVPSTTTEANKAWYEPLIAEVVTYIVSTSSAITTESTTDATITNFRCTYKKGDKTSHIDNFDDSCKLIGISAPTDEKKITSLQEFKNSATPTTTLTASTFYKLTLNPKLLYNLDFQNTTGALTVEVAISNGTSKGNVALHQKLSGNAFVGKTNLVLAKVTVGKADADGTATDKKCNFSQTPATGQFACDLHAATKTDSSSPIDLHKLTISESKATDTFTVGNYYVIKLTTPEAISTLTQSKKIYYQMAKTSGDTSNKHESVELEIIQLLSGDFASTKKPLFISNYSAPTAA